MLTPIRPVIVLAAMLPALLSCESSNPSRPQGSTSVATAASAASPRSSGNADDLLIVDCMLPGRIKRLGNMTYVTSRRPIKTSALECNIRGGEYVAYDRADHATSLRVWLEQAEAGDAQAQTYVGEIYEKALGVPADYAAAARWYRRAAEQGFARAQINLGYLYENGLGVNKDRSEALRWYRRAAGGEQLVFADSAPAPAPRPVARPVTRPAAAATVAAGPVHLQRRLAGEQRRATELKQELSGVHHQLDQQQHKLLMAQQELEQTRAQLARQQPQPDAVASAASLEAELVEARQRERALQQAVSAEQGNSAAMSSELAEAHGQLSDYQQQLSSGQQQLRQQQQALDSNREALQRERDNALLSGAQQQELQRLLEQRQQQIDRLQQQLAQSQDIGSRLEQARERYRQAQQRLSGESLSSAQLRSELLGAQTELARAQTLVSQQGDALALLEREQSARISALEQQLQAQDAAAVQRLQAEVGSHAAELTAQRSRLQQLRNAADARVTALADSLAAMQGSNQALQQQLAAQTRTVAELKAELVTAKADKASTVAAHSREKQALLASSQGDIQQLQQQLQAREDALRAERERLAQLTTEAQGYQQQLAQLEQADSDAAAIEAAPAVAVAAPLTRGGGSSLDVQGIRFGNYYALIIGNNRYQHLKPLRSAASDAEAVQQVLQNRYGFRTTLLLDATRYQIISALNQMREQLTENDNLLVYYAGHGELDRSNTKGYWLPVDAEPNSNANWISNGSITEIINTLSARHVLVVADSCYSGSLTRSSVAQLPKGISADKRRKYLQIMVGLQSRTVLTSGGLAPVLDAGNSGHSVFAQAFLDTLRSNSGVLEGQQLFSDVFQQVRADSARLALQQFPEYAPLRFAGHESGDFFFVSRRATVSDAARLSPDLRRIAANSPLPAAAGGR